MVVLLELWLPSRRPSSLDFILSESSALCRGVLFPWSTSLWLTSSLQLTHPTQSTPSCLLFSPKVPFRRGRLSAQKTIYAVKRHFGLPGASKLTSLRSRPRIFLLRRWHCLLCLAWWSARLPATLVTPSLLFFFASSNWAWTGSNVLGVNHHFLVPGTWVPWVWAQTWWSSFSFLSRSSRPEGSSSPEVYINLWSSPSEGSQSPRKKALSICSVLLSSIFLSIHSKALSINSKELVLPRMWQMVKQMVCPKAAHPAVEDKTQILAKSKKNGVSHQEDDPDKDVWQRFDVSKSDVPCSRKSATDITARK